MTATGSGPTVRTTARSARGPALGAVALVLSAAVAAAAAATGSSTRLDPASYAPGGAHAVTALLAEHGVRVHRVEKVGALTADGAGTVFVPVPAALSVRDLRQLATLPVTLVVVGATGAELAALTPGVRQAPGVEVQDRRPSCALDIATRAGDAEIGGPTYTVDPAEGAVGCYASAGRATLLRLPSRRSTLLGSGNLLTNDRLARRGNAALALGLLGAGGDVQWLLPRPGASTAATPRSLNGLLPRAIPLGALQLLIAAVALALWRARALGRPVTEPLPVVVRAAEAVEGRSRLYRVANARGAAADSLRAGARARLVRRLGLTPDADQSAVVEAVSRRAPAPPAEVAALLYGAAPGDDAALIRLADDLDTLTREVAGT